MDTRYKDIHIIKYPGDKEEFVERGVENLELTENTLHYDKVYGDVIVHSMIRIDLPGHRLVID